MPSLDTKSPGLEAAKAISMITGVAISPLLGVGAVGAYEYFNSPVARRARLSWYAQPWFWLPALLVVALVGLKDVVGTALPPGLKKPLDALETIENKISGLIAAGAFVPLVVSIFGHHAGGGARLEDNLIMMAAVDWSTVGNLLLTPFAIVAFGLVWLVSHAIHILILLSPWGAVDAVLKSARLFLMALITGVSFANPYAGAGLSILIIVIAYFLAGWSFRLMICGSVFVWDFLTFRRTRFAPDAAANWMFTARELEGAPIRSYGKLTRAGDGQLRFDYRPWLVLPRRTFTLQPVDHILGRGWLYPEIVRLDRATGETQNVFVLPPRYRTHEETLARLCGLAEVRDVGLLKGFKAAWHWLRSLFGGRSKLAPLSSAA